MPPTIHQQPSSPPFAALDDADPTTPYRYPNGYSEISSWRPRAVSAFCVDIHVPPVPRRDAVRKKASAAQSRSMEVPS